MTEKLKKSLRNLNRQKSDKLNLINGVLGITINGAPTVQVPGRDGYVFVQLRGNISELIQAYNASVSPIYGLPVLVVRQENRYAIYGRDIERYGDWGQSAYLPLHGDQHSFAPSLGLGGDVTWIYSQQFVPLSAVPSGSSGAGNVIVNSHTYLDPIDGVWKYIGDEGSPNLLVAKPSGSSARMMLLAWDIVAQDPVFITGTTFPNIITGSSAIVPYLPSISNNRLIPIAGIRLVSGTDVIGWENIYDLRQFAVAQTPPFMGGIMIQDEGSDVGTGSVLNFVGDGVSASVVGSVITVTVSGSSGVGGGSGIDTIGIAGQDEGTNLGTGTVLNVVGAGATFSRSGTVLRLEVPSAAINTGTLDARYLKIDASNDPVTGILDINNLLRVNSFDFRVSNGGVDVETNGFIGGLFKVRNSVGYPMDLEQLVTGSTVSIPVLYMLRQAQSPALAPVFTEAAIVVDSIDEAGSTVGGLIRYNLNGTDRVDINPSQSGSGTAVLFDADSLAHNGKLLLLSNAGSPRFFVNGSGTAHSNGVALIKEAPADGQQYARKNSGWEPVVGASGTPGSPGAPGANGAFGVFGQDEGLNLGTGTTVNFVGAGVTATLSGTVLNVNIPGGGGNPPVTGTVVIQDEGSTLGSVPTINFSGAGVTSSISGTTANVNIPGGITTILNSLVTAGAGAANFDVGISGSYSMIKMFLTGRGTTAATNVVVLLTFNNDTTDSNYRRGQHRASSVAHGFTGADDRAIALLPAATSTRPRVAGQAEITILDPFQSVFEKNAQSSVVLRFDAEQEVWSYGTEWENNAALDRLTLAPSAGNFASGTHCVIYGYQ